MHQRGRSSGSVGAARLAQHSGVGGIGGGGGGSLQCWIRLRLNLLVFTWICGMRCAAWALPLLALAVLAGARAEVIVDPAAQELIKCVVENGGSMVRHGYWRAWRILARRVLSLKPLTQRDRHVGGPGGMPGWRNRRAPLRSPLPAAAAAACSPTPSWAAPAPPARAACLPPRTSRTAK